ncbi:hypothetical protein [Pelagibius sp.]|uniref:hypothetical protein n=1 Tax=Pelagibius sp. TaxID=1931238 RepID=UPI003B512D53
MTETPPTIDSFIASSSSRATAPQPPATPFVAGIADTAAELQRVTLSNGNSVAVDATRHATAVGFTLRARLFDPLGNPLGEEITFLFATAWDIATPEFEIVVLGNDRVVILSQDPVDILTIRDFEAPEHGLETFRRKTDVNAARFSTEDYLWPKIAGLDDGGDRADWVDTQTDEEWPETERREKTADGHAAAEVAFSRYHGALHAEPGSHSMTTESGLQIRDRDDADNANNRIYFRVNEPGLAVVAREDLSPPAARGRTRYYPKALRRRSPDSRVLLSIK